MSTKTAFFFALIGIFFVPTWVQSAPPTNIILHPDGPGGTVSPPNNATLSPDDWQELRAARMAALKANPSLVTTASQLNEKLRQFEQKLNAAMLKTDPNIAPVLAKFAASRPAPHPTATPVPPPKPQ